MKLSRTVATATAAGLLTLVAPSAPAVALDWQPITGHGSMVLATCADGSQVLSGDHADPQRNRYALELLLDRDGNVTGMVLMLRYASAFTHSSTGQTIDGSGTDRIVFDFATGTQTHTGGRWTVAIAGSGWVIKEAGRITYDGDGAVIDYTGVNEGDWAKLCSYFGVEG